MVQPGGIGLGLGGDDPVRPGGVDQPRGVGRRNPGADVGGGDLDRRPTPVAIAVFVDVGLAVGAGNQHAEVTPAVGDQAGDPRREPAGDAVAEPLRRQGELEPRIVERLGGAQFDGPADAALVLVGRVGLAHAHPVEQLRGEDAVVEGPRAAGRAAVVEAGRGGGGDLHAVDLGAGEVRAEAAERDLPPLARIAGDGQAGNALQGFGEVQVREGRDVLRQDDVL